MFRLPLLAAATIALSGCFIGAGIKDMYIAKETPGIYYLRDSGWCGAPPDSVVMSLAQDRTDRKNALNSRIEMGIGFFDEANPTLQMSIDVRYEEGLPTLHFLSEEIIIRDDDGPVGTVALSSFDGSFQDFDGTSIPFQPWVKPRGSLETGEIPPPTPEKTVGHFYDRYDYRDGDRVNIERWVRFVGEAPIRGLAGETIILVMPQVEFNGQIVTLPEARFEKGTAAGRVLAINACTANRAGV